MMSPVSSPVGAAPVAEANVGGASAVPGFASKLDAAVGRVDSMQLFADGALTKLASGGDVDIHGAMIALEEAEIGLKAMVAVRDKVVSAYETLMNLAI